MTCVLDECSQGRKPCPAPDVCCGKCREPEPVGYESAGRWPITSNGGAQIDTERGSGLRVVAWLVLAPLFAVACGVIAAWLWRIARDGL